MATWTSSISLFKLHITKHYNTMGNTPTLSQQIQHNKLMTFRVVRELDRELESIEEENAKMETEIRKLAEKKQYAAMRILAKDIGRSRTRVTRCYLMRSNLNALNAKFDSMKTTHEMAKSMARMTRSMKHMNKSMNMSKIRSLAMVFERETEKLDIKMEMMDDVLEDVFEDPDIDEDSEELVDQVLAEMGLVISGELGRAPTDTVLVDREQSELEERLNNLHN